MKHYIVLFVEGEGPFDSWFSRHYIASAEDPKDTPTFILPHEDPNYQTIKKCLVEDGFKEIEKFGKDLTHSPGGLQPPIVGLSIEEIMLGDVHQVTGLFFAQDETFLRMAVFDRTFFGIPNWITGDLLFKGGNRK